ncbi:hypothetical protein [Gordonia alkanivorans]|uniref:hypothetical protein n=1 Tax=Gordonia alkanivorans TaxID=84096 RepID=UPI0024B832A2|nr:hypothetical protein [Gordonia alkanivorans]MDJ0006502.1 hypothetical protein [Gordonia alkanivorans]MDJ0492130.1 hypothetical protein [Gordonia alkanivorans]
MYYTPGWGALMTLVGTLGGGLGGVYLTVKAQTRNLLSERAEAKRQNAKTTVVELHANAILACDQADDKRLRMMKMTSTLDISIVTALAEERRSARDEEASTRRSMRKLVASLAISTDSSSPLENLALKVLAAVTEYQASVVQFALTDSVRVVRGFVRATGLPNAADYEAALDSIIDGVDPIAEDKLIDLKGEVNGALNNLLDAARAL